MDPHLFAAAARFHETGAVAQAAPLYRRLLKDAPDHLELWCRLGDACVALGDPDAAAASYRQALRLAPDHPAVLNNLGLVLTGQRRLDDAAASFRHALRVQPDSPEAHNHLGIALSEQGKLADAEAAFRRAAELKPGYAGAHLNLGVSLARLGTPVAALAALTEALRLQPDSPLTQLHRGNVLRGLGRRAEAVEAYRAGLGHAPDNPDLHQELGATLMDDGRPAEAEAHFRAAARLRPDSPPAYNHLAICLMELGRWDDGMTAYRQALHLDPGFVEALTNLGRGYAVRGMAEEALDCFERAVALNPGHPGALNNLANARRDEGLVREAVDLYRRAVLARPDDAAVHSNSLFALDYLPGADPGEVLREHQEFGRRHSRPQPDFPRSGRAGRARLRVGYVSSDFRDHAVAFFLEPILAAHDRDAVEVFCYSDVTRDDDTTRRLRPHAEKWRDVARLPHDQLAELIRGDKVDVLVDLAGHTAGNRLPAFALRPAPVQVTYLGYLGSTGLPAIDYRVTDGHADPEGLSEAYHTERLVRLPDTAMCYRPPDCPEVGPLPAAANGFVTFGSLNNVTKVNGEVVGLWARVLHAVPGSRLVLRTGAGRRADDRLRAEFGGHGVAADRVRLVGKTPTRREYFGLYHQLDLGLDPFPYNGVTTSCDALWMGVPLVTLAGRTPSGRQGVGFLRNVGLPELVADTPDGYVEAARGAAADLARLSRWRAELRPRMASSPLTDGPRFTRHLEAAYRAMRQRWLAGPEPATPGAG